MKNKERYFLVNYEIYKKNDYKVANGSHALYTLNDEFFNNNLLKEDIYKYYLSKTCRSEYKYEDLHIIFTNIYEFKNKRDYLDFNKQGN